MTQALAARAVARQCEGVLLPDVLLPFDDSDLAGITVADVLTDPARFEGATLADPLEGVEYGRCKAKIMRRADGTPWIHSFAHGRTFYELRHDARAVAVAIDKAGRDKAADTFISMALAADLAEDEEEVLRDQAADRAGIGKRALTQRLKRERQQQAERRAAEERQEAYAERQDPRPQLPAPAPDAEWLPQMKVLDDVLSASRAPEPPMRDVEGWMTAVRIRRAAMMHTLTAAGPNKGDMEESRFAAPEQPLLTRLDETQLAELIERHVEYVDASGKPVHLGGAFVKHYLVRHDHVLPTVTAVATLPMVLPNGTILTGRGLDRETGIAFRVPDELQTLLPTAADCTGIAVAGAMRFLTDDWLRDVATDYPGKCVLVAMALTIIERLLLPERPAFFITAGQRGGGKTTTANMIAAAVIGRRASAAAWSPSDEERRKALLAYLGEGVPFIVWDNIPRGTAISCPSIEKALTAETYSDRVLGVSETRTVPATTVQTFTGNNVTPRGDLASRSLSARLTVERPDPENRRFVHPDPLAWTEANRGRIISCLYTLLLGSPRLRASNPSPASTRFKAWWHLVGAAVEHAARQHVLYASPGACAASAAIEINFRDLFLIGESADEQTGGLSALLAMIGARWPTGCKASEIVQFVSGGGDDAAAFKAALESASDKPIKEMTSGRITWTLKGLTDAPVAAGGDILTLRYTPDSHGGRFAVGTIR